ncbi:hypothetical protein GYA25_01645 [Candidatus Woesearchaeota archaeon]|jgi:hypothetical protein|nr:hypothetical protein [Candidatus Woesearchaeota archaeon]
MIERQIRYNYKTETGEQIYLRHRWVFCIINEPREIQRIREKIYLELSPIEDLRNLYEGLISKSGGLHSDFFSFSTDKFKIENPKKIYNSKKIYKDRNLQEKDEAGLERYLNSLLR